MISMYIFLSSENISHCTQQIAIIVVTQDLVHLFAVAIWQTAHQLILLLSPLFNQHISNIFIYCIYKLLKVIRKFTNCINL